MKKQTPRADPLFYDKVGKYIELWLADNRKGRIKPGTSKELANMVRKTPAQMSKYIHGITTMPAEVMSSIMSMHNFNPKYWDNYQAQKNDINLEHLTIEDTHRLVRELQILSDKYKDGFYKYSDAYSKLQSDNQKLVMEAMKLVTDNDNLRQELREVRKQLKLAKSNGSNFVVIEQD